MGCLIAKPMSFGFSAKMAGLNGSLAVPARARVSSPETRVHFRGQGRRRGSKTGWDGGSDSTRAATSSANFDQRAILAAGYVDGRRTVDSSWSAQPLTETPARLEDTS